MPDCYNPPFAKTRRWLIIEIIRLRIISKSGQQLISHQSIEFSIVKHLISVKVLHSAINLTNGYDAGALNNTEIATKTAGSIYFYIVKDKKPELVRKQHVTNTILLSQSAYPIDPKNVFYRTKKKLLKKAQNTIRKMSSLTSYSIAATVYVNQRIRCKICGKVYISNAMNFHMLKRHTVTAKARCSICNIAPQGLISHIINQHPEFFFPYSSSIVVKFETLPRPKRIGETRH
jgi:hypothetical protein